jgi:hypothetical protein
MKALAVSILFSLNITERDFSLSSNSNNVLNKSVRKSSFFWAVHVVLMSNYKSYDDDLVLLLCS